MLSMSEKHAWLIQVKEIAPEMRRISWLGKKNGQQPVLPLCIRIPSISVTGAKIQTEKEVFHNLLRMSDKSLSLLGRISGDTHILLRPEITYLCNYA